MSEKRGGAYPITQYHGSHFRPVCMWPGCRLFAITELREPGTRDWICLCTPHRRTWDELPMRSIETMPWTQRQKRAA